MNKILSFLKRHSKKVSIVVGVSAAVVLGVAAASAWGPTRDTYTIDHPADHVTFNSIIDNPNIGDEREFVSVKDAANTTEGGWRDSATVEPGKEYWVRIYAHNNAASSLNLTAENTRVSANVPTTTGKEVSISGFVTADNARPNQVWDDIKLSSDKTFNLAYVPGSARIYNNGYAAGGNGQQLPDSIVTSAGAKIGYEGADGKVPGCFQYANYVYFKVKPQFAAVPNYSITKEVRARGTTAWSKHITAQPGQEVEWRMQFQNTGSTQLNDISVVDETPQNTKTVAGSVQLYDANFPNGYTFGSNAIQGNLINLNIGNYGAHSNAWIYYNSKIDSADKLPCQTSHLVNKVYVTPTTMPTIKDEASVDVTKECQEPQYSCDALTADRLNIKVGEKANFTAKGSASNGATITGYIFKVNGTVAQDSASDKFAYTGTNEGAYTVSVIVKTNKGNTAENDNCKKQVKVTKEAPKPVYECTGLNVDSLGNNKYRFTANTHVENGASVNKYVFNYGDATAEFNTTNATVEHSYAKPGEYAAKVKVVFNVGNEQKVVESNTCATTIKIAQNPCVYNPSLPADSKDCKPTTPPTPVTVIPSTGAGGVAAGIFGTSAAAYAAVALVEKRRSLNK